MNRVTKADRLAAAPILRLYGAENYAVLCEKNEPHCDQLAMLQAFAAHRIAALESVLAIVKAERDRLNKAYKEEEPGMYAATLGGGKLACNYAATLGGGKLACNAIERAIRLITQEGE